MSDTTSETRSAGLLYLAFMLSGAAGLIYEVMWARSFSLVFGSTAQAAAAVLAAFFAGLAGGSFLGARLTKRRERAVLGYAATEIVVIATALAVNVWLLLFHQWYPALYRSPLGGAGTMVILKLLFAFVALGPPSMAMGMTLPLMARALVRSTSHMGRRVSFAYGLNSLGATLGVLLAGFVLPPLLGTTNTIYLAAGLNLVAAALAVVHWRLVEAGQSSAEAPAPPTSAVRPPTLIALVVIVSGFGTLALEVLYTRLISNIADSSTFSFATILATFLVGLAAASLAISVLVDRVKNLWRLLAWTQTCGAIAIYVSPACFTWALSFRKPEYDESLSGYLMYLFGTTLATIGPAVLLVGTALPTAWKIATCDSATVGQRVGRLTGLNTLAGVVGSVIAGFVLIPMLGVANSLIVIAFMYAALAIVLWRAVTPSRWPLAMILLVAVFAILFAFGIPGAIPLLTQPGEYVVFFQEGEAANVTVLQSPDGIRILRINNHYTLGSSQPETVNFQRGQGGLPLLLHSDPHRVAFIGVATGSSVSSVLDFPVHRVVAIELVPGVVTAAEKFKIANRGVLEDPRVEVLVADGRNHLFATDELFDVVVADLFVPWHAGVDSLYTKEHFAAVSRRLAPGGIFAQWLPGHQLSIEELRIITHTFLEVYPEAEMWISRALPSSPMIALLGYADGPPDDARRARAESSKVFRNLEFVASGKRLGQWAGSALVNTDQFPRIEFSAAANRHEKGSSAASMLILRIVEELGNSSVGED